MKTNLLLLIFVLTAFWSRGQNPPRVIVLTSHDVDTNSVRLITPPSTPRQNVVFRYNGKTSKEIRAISDSHPHVKIMRDGMIMAETVDGGCAGWVDKQTNFVGLVLIFNNYDQAKAAEKALRGD